MGFRSPFIDIPVAQLADVAQLAQIFSTSSHGPFNIIVWTSYGRTLVAKL